MKGASLRRNSPIAGGRVGALEEDAEQAEGMKPGELTNGETRVAMMVGGNGGDRSKRSLAETQSPARKMPRGGVQGGRSHGRDFLDEVMGMMDGDQAEGKGAQSIDREQVEPGYQRAEVELERLGLRCSRREGGA